MDPYNLNINWQASFYGWLAVLLIVSVVGFYVSWAIKGLSDGSGRELLALALGVPLLVVVTVVDPEGYVAAAAVAFGAGGAFAIVGGILSQTLARFWPSRSLDGFAVAVLGGGTLYVGNIYTNNGTMIFGAVVAALGFAIVGFNGKLPGLRATVRNMLQLVWDVFGFSPRRAWALAWHTILESIRRRILLVFAVFGVLFLFAGWYLPVRPHVIVQGYVSFVMMSMTLITIIAMSVLSATSLPADIKQKTVHTVVTKPVRRLEMVIGKFLGFSFIATILLVMMGGVSYVYLVRSVNGTRATLQDDLESSRGFLMTSTRSDADSSSLTEGSLPDSIRTSLSSRDVRLSDAVSVAPLTDESEWLIRSDGDEGPSFEVVDTGSEFRIYERSRLNQERVDKLRDDINQLDTRMVARIPIVGNLTFYDKDGQNEKGRDVGSESKKRSYVLGNSAEVAIWRFSDIPVEEILEKGELPVELTFTVFRTLKGVVGDAVIGQITFKNPNTGVEIDDTPFGVREFYMNRIVLRDDPDDPSRSLARLLEESDGALEVQARCLSSSQFLGMGRDDLYILRDNASFAANFFKGVIGVWTRVLLILTVSITCSTFLSSPIALLATAVVFIGGLCMPFLTDLTSGGLSGGGPLESMVRIWQHENLKRDLGDAPWLKAGQGVDKVFIKSMEYLVNIVPDLRFFNSAPLVADGIDIPYDALAYSLVVAFVGYILPFLIGGFFLLQSREIAR